METLLSLVRNSETNANAEDLNANAEGLNANMEDMQAKLHCISETCNYVCKPSVLWKKPSASSEKLSDSRKKPSGLQKKPSNLRQRRTTNAFQKGVTNCGINFKDTYRTWQPQANFFISLHSSTDPSLLILMLRKSHLLLQTQNAFLSMFFPNNGTLWRYGIYM